MKDIIDTVTSILVITFVVVVNHFYDAHNYWGNAQFHCYQKVHIILCGGQCLGWLPQRPQGLDPGVRHLLRRGREIKNYSWWQSIKDNDN